MPLANTILIIALVIGVLIALYAGFKKGAKMRALWGIVAGVLIVVPILGLTGTIDVGFLEFGGELISGDGVTTPTGEQLPISTFTAVVSNAISGAYNDYVGDLEIYDKDVDPRHPNANVILKVAVNNGTGTSDTKILKTNKLYRVILVNGSSGGWYAKDYGVMAFSNGKGGYNQETGDYTFTDDEGAVRIATLNDMIDETTSNGDVNGNTSATLATDELYGQADSFVINESSVSYDSSFYWKPSFSASGTNRALLDPVLCFTHATTNNPEGNEYSQFTSESVEGTDMGVPSDLLNYWANDICVELGYSASSAMASGLIANDPTDGHAYRYIESGKSGKYKFTISAVDANQDANDDWSLVFDDLGDDQGQDVGLTTGATRDTTSFDCSEV